MCVLVCHSALWFVEVGGPYSQSNNGISINHPCKCAWVSPSTGHVKVMMINIPYKPCCWLLLVVGTLAGVQNSGRLLTPGLVGCGGFRHG